MEKSERSQNTTNPKIISQICTCNPEWWQAWAQEPLSPQDPFYDLRWADVHPRSCGMAGQPAAGSSGSQATPAAHDQERRVRDRFCTQPFAIIRLRHDEPADSLDVQGLTHAVSWGTSVNPDVAAPPFSEDGFVKKTRCRTGVELISLVEEWRTVVKLQKIATTTKG